MGNDIRFALVEDDDQDLERLKKYIDRYVEQKKCTADIQVFRNGLDFLDAYKPIYDVVLMDIEMPYLDGLSTARRLRDMDPQVALIFITWMAQYAINGYEVAALDYMVKPIVYGVLSDKLDHAFARIQRQSSLDMSVFLCVGADSYRKVEIDDILYIVKDKNYLRYVTRNEELRVRGTLKDVEAQFEGSTVVKCANGCMVNLRYIEQKVRNTVYVGGLQFTITKPYLDGFTERFMQFLRK